MKKWKKKLLFKSLAISASIASFCGVILSFIKYGEDKWWIGLVIFLGIFLLLFVMIYCVLRLHKHNKISSRGSIYIETRYGDILKFKTKKGIKPVIVIPVNSSFDTLVEDDLSIKDRIVDGGSIHGQWILKYAPDENSLEALQNDIKLGIRNRNLTVQHVLPNKRGNKEVYELGSYIFVEREQASFLLFALTEFNENNKVIKSDQDNFKELMEKLLASTDDCPNRHVFIPIMGNKIALFGLDTMTAFQYIKNVSLNKKNSLRASISIVIYNDDRDKVSIYD